MPPAYPPGWRTNGLAAGGVADVVRPEITEVAARHDATPAQVALAWVLCQERVAEIARSGNPAHVAENAACLDIHLTDEDLDRLDAAFPPPTAAQPLEVL